MGILSFNYYYKQAQQPEISEGEWVPWYIFLIPNSRVPTATWMWVDPYIRTQFSSKKYSMLIDDYTNQGVVVSNPWYVVARNAFVVTSGGGDLNSETLYTDIIKVSKFHPLHQRDQSFQLFFYMTDNFVTDTDPAFLFYVTDNTLINYYNDMVDKYYPVVT